MKPATLAFFTALLIYAQPTPRTLSGTVGDAHGAALSAVDVTLTPTAGGAPQRALTDAEGRYRLTGLTPGTYTARFETSGFATQEQRITIPPDRNPTWDIVLTPQLSTERIAVVTTADAASSRPAYLPQSGLSPNSILTAYGSFPTDVQARLTGPSSSIFLPLLYKTPGQIGAVLPNLSELYPEFLELTGSSGAPVRYPFRIIPARPTFFTVDQSGSGDAILTTAEFDLVTRFRPAQPSGFYTAWLSNGGRSDPAQPVVQDKRNLLSSFDLFVANRRVPAADILYFGPSGIGGLDQLNVKLSNPFPFQGCGVPMQIVVTPVAGGPQYFGIEVTIPVSASGGCEDALGFDRAEMARLTSGNPVGTLDARISEVTFISSSAAPRNVVFGTLTGSEFRNETYRPPPPLGTCQFRWSPPGAVSPVRRLNFNGAATLNLPWGSFNFSPTSNNGPYSLAFSFPSNFTTGNYSLNFPNGFTIDNRPFTFQTSGTYDRAPGLMREAVAAQFQTFPPEIAAPTYYDRFIESILRSPDNLRSRVVVDFNIVFSDPTRGNSAIRCTDLGTSDFGFLKPAIRNYEPLIPQNVNDVTASIRFFPRDRIRRTLDGTSNVLFINFDSAVQFSGIGLQVPR